MNSRSFLCIFIVKDNFSHWKRWILIIFCFRLIEVSNKKGRKTASMHAAYYSKGFPFFFRLIPQLTETNTYFSSFNLHFKKSIILTPIKAGLFPTFDDTYDVTIHFLDLIKTTSIFKPIKTTLINVKWLMDLWYRYYYEYS